MNKEWLEKCAQAGEFLYGIYPYEVLLQMYRLRESDSLPKRELRTAINDSAALSVAYVQRRLLTFDQMGYHEAGYLLPVPPPSDNAGDPYAALHVDPDELEHLLEEQGDRPFYIPTAREIEALCRDGYIRNQHYESLDRFLRKHGGPLDMTRKLWRDFSSGIDFMDEIQYFFDNVGKDSRDPAASGLPMEKVHQALELLQACYNSTNLRANRGWAPDKLFRKYGGSQRPPTLVPVSTKAAELLRQADQELAARGIQVEYESGFSSMAAIGQHGEIRKIKVGRNDPCPCGSGKKYKKCCGR